MTKRARSLAILRRPDIDERTQRCSRLLLHQQLRPSAAAVEFRSPRAAIVNIRSTSTRIRVVVVCCRCSFAVAHRLTRLVQQAVKIFERRPCSLKFSMRFP